MATVFNHVCHGQFPMALKGYFFALTLEEVWEVLGGLAAMGRGLLDLGGGLFLAEELEVLLWLAFSPPVLGRRPSPLRQ